MDDTTRLAYESIPADMRPLAVVRHSWLDTDALVVLLLPGNQLWVYDVDEREGYQVDPREVWRVGLECVIGDNPSEWEPGEN